MGTLLARRSRPDQARLGIEELAQPIAVLYFLCFFVAHNEDTPQIRTDDHLGRDGVGARRAFSRY